MEKYKLLFNFLKKKVGSDAARIIVYKVYCNDMPKKESVWERLVRIYERWAIKRYGSMCSAYFIRTNFMIRTDNIYIYYMKKHSMC